MNEYIDANGNPIEERLYCSKTLFGRINVFYTINLKDDSGKEGWVAQFPDTTHGLTIDSFASCYPLSDGEVENLNFIIEMSGLSREEQLLKIKDKLGFMAK